MSKAFTEPSLGVRLYDYFQVDKIAQLYNQTVERVEMSLSRKEQKGRTQTVKGEGGLGRLLALLGIELSIGGALESSSAVCEETVHQLSSEHKLQIVWRHLYLEGLVSDLNRCLREGLDATSFVLVAFKGTNGKFAFADADGEHDSPEALIRVQCEIEGLCAEFFCSRKYLRGGSNLLYDIQEGLVRDVAGIAAVKALDLEGKGIVLNPVCF